jgi:hypothetical protein
MHADTQPRHDRHDVLSGEVEVLEEEKDEEVEDKGRDENEFTIYEFTIYKFRIYEFSIYDLLIRYSRGGVGDDGAGKQQEGVGGLPVHVEIVAGSKQEQVAETQRGECVVEHAHYGEEYEERETIEQQFI